MPTLLALALAAQVKVLVLPLQNLSGVTPEVAGAVTETLVGELRRGGMAVITQQELGALLGVEKQKQMLGCAEGACLAEIGGALGVDRIVLGNLSVLGESWLVHVKLYDVKKAKAVTQVDRRLRKATVDDVLDQLPGIARELLAEGAAGRPAARNDRAAKGGAGQVGDSTASATRPLAPGAVDEPAQVDRSKLSLAGDGKGHFVAFLTSGDTGDGGLFASSDGGKTFFAQRVFGGGSDGQGGFDYVFWEPRARVPADASFYRREGKLFLTCGDQAKPMELAAVPPARAKAALARAKFLKPRWRRRAVQLLTEQGGRRYILVDQAREPEENHEDYRLFIGPKGRLLGYDVTDHERVAPKEEWETPAGTLTLEQPAAGGAPAARWSNGGVFEVASVEQNARFIYGKLGAYASERLGTACDDWLGR